MISNVLAVARRELVARAATRTYAVTTLILVLAAAAVGLAPVAIGYFTPGVTHVAVYVGAPDLAGDPVATLDTLLNPGPAAAETGDSAFVVSLSTDLAADRGAVLDGRLTALLDVERDDAGELAFTVYTNQPDDGTTAMISRQAATSIAVADRLGHLGLAPAQQAGLFAGAAVTIRSPDPSKPVESSRAIAQQIADVAVIVAVEMFLLLAIVLYGTWIAQSVVEEKSSRMMEVILSAASPFELLTGKVLGVSAAALLQLAAVVVTAGLALGVEGQVAALVLGETASVGLPSGLSPSMLVALTVFFVLGFLLYAVLFAAAGSLVSRQEDVSAMTTPMLLLVMLGYLVALYASLGTIQMDAPWVVALSWVPFLSPYMMLSRFNAGVVGPFEVALAALLLAATIVLMAWVAARIYSAGVLLYGQKASLRVMWRAVREAR
jgi:ABC-2 type transport system permease protein